MFAFGGRLLDVGASGDSERNREPITPVSLLAESRVVLTSAAESRWRGRLLDALGFSDEDGLTLAAEASGSSMKSLSSPGSEL